MRVDFLKITYTHIQRSAIYNSHSNNSKQAWLKLPRKHREGEMK